MMYTVNVKKKYTQGLPLVWFGWDSLPVSHHGRSACGQKLEIAVDLKRLWLSIGECLTPFKEMANIHETHMHFIQILKY